MQSTARIGSPLDKCPGVGETLCCFDFSIFCLLLALLTLVSSHEQRLRATQRAHLERIFFEDFAFAQVTAVPSMDKRLLRFLLSEKTSLTRALIQANDVEKHLWMLHYKTIEDFRQRITKLSSGPAAGDVGAERALAKARAAATPPPARVRKPPSSPGSRSTLALALAPP